MASGDYQKKREKCRPKNPCVLIRKLVDLMEHPISENATERHLQMLNDFLNASHYAFWLQDIPYIIRLYECIVKKFDQVPQYKLPLECLLYFSAIPPMLTKNSDKLEYARDFQEYFSVLGYLILCLHDDDLKRLVLNAIRNLLRPKPPIGYCCVPVSYCKEAAGRSRLPEVLAQLVQVVSKDIYPQLLDVIYMVCNISPTVCEKMVGEEAIEFLLRRLEPTWNKRNSESRPRNPSGKSKIPILEDTCCILWKLLNVVDPQMGIVKDPSVFALWSLQYAFRWTNVCLGQKVNRNNVTALILKIMTTFPTMPFIESDLGEDIAVLAMTAAGCGCHSNLEFTEDELDFQFKKIIWACLHFFDQYQNAEIIKESELVKAFTKALFQEHSANRDHIEQYCELAKIILKIIPKFLPCSIDIFLQLNGPIKIVKMVEGYLLKTYEIEVLECYMFCLNQMIMIENDDIVTILGENGAFDIVTSVCAKILETETLSTIYQKILARGFCILQILCVAGYMTDDAVITLCISYLNRVIHPYDNDPLIDARVTICALHLLWECVLTSGPLYRKFLKNGGIYVMLDITEMCTFPIKVLSLGILADSTQKPACVPYFITWRKHGKKLLPVLMEIFRNKTEKICESIENVEIGERKKENHWLALCDKQRVVVQPQCVTNIELLKSCRNKIHAILYALKVRFRESVEVANEHYKLYNNEKLSTDDALTMLFAENFFSLNMCHSWLTVFKELQKEGITPVDADNEALMDKIQRIRQWKQFLRGKIEELVHRESQQEHFIELETYTILKEARLSDALDGLTELRYISNCTERMFRMRKKLMLQQEVEVMRVTGANYHRTICEGPFTNIYNQKISIQSNVICERKDEPVPPTPVSLDDNESLASDITGHALSEHQLEC